MNQLVMLFWVVGCGLTMLVVGMIVGVSLAVFWDWPIWKATMAYDAIGLVSFSVMLISGILQRDLDRVIAGGCVVIMSAWHLWDEWKKHRKKRSPGRLLGWLVVDLGHRLGTERA